MPPGGARVLVFRILSADYLSTKYFEVLVAASVGRARVRELDKQKSIYHYDSHAEIAYAKVRFKAH